MAIDHYHDFGFSMTSAYDPTVPDVPVSDQEADSLVASLFGNDPDWVGLGAGLAAGLGETGSNTLSEATGEATGLDELVARLDRLTASQAGDVPVRTPRRVATEKIVLFELAENLLAFRMSAVLEVLSLPTYTPLPHSPDWLWGVANLRGEIVPVFDLARAFALGASPDPRTARLLVIRSQAEEMTLGIVASRVIGLRPLVEYTPMDIPSGATGLHACLAGFSNQAGLVVAVCDADRLARSTLLPEIGKP
jgi:chemotaxis signal transduction protein